MTYPSSEDRWFVYYNAKTDKIFLANDFMDGLLSFAPVFMIRLGRL